MAERRKPVISTSDDKQLDSDKLFLERTNVNTAIRDVLGKIIANRPEDPISFLADYFESLLVEDESSHVQRAVRILTMTHHSQPVFEINVREAYNLLMKHKIGKKLQGLNGAVFTELLQGLCKNLPSTVTHKLIKKLECHDYEAVPYDIFRSSVFTCCVLLEFAAVTEQLYSSLDLQNNGRPDKILCDAVLNQLKTALGSSRTDVKRIMESSYNLAPEGLQQVLERALNREQIQGFCAREQFVTEASDLFLSKVKRLK